MSDSTRSRDVVDERAAGSAESVVERDGRAEREEARGQASAKVGQGPRAVALEREDVLGRPEDRLDPLSDRRELRAAAGLVAAPWPQQAGALRGDRVGEGLAGVALVPDQRLPTASAAGEQLRGDRAFIELRADERERTGSAVGGEQAMQSEAPEEARMRRAIAVVGGLGERGSGAWSRRCARIRPGSSRPTTRRRRSRG